MPIKYREAESVTDIERKLSKFEERYGMTSEAFAAEADDRVHEFDSIEWSFLLMQKQALEEDAAACGNGSVVWSNETRLREVDDLRDAYSQIAA